ncbi:MAG: hypothetical protein HQL05_04525 [Nitrospirae bacterium]|nr:hypothetical protein [Nitrospirota bacterium]
MADQFGASTQQDIKSGGDGAKLYGWNVLNSANASVIDVNYSNAGYLTFVTGNYSDPDAAGYPFTVPFVYQNITGDFEIDIKRDALTSGSNFRFWLIARDPTASAGEDYVAIWTYYDSGGVNYLAKRRSIANSIQSPGDSLLDPADPPLCTKIQRAGNTFKFYTSTDGTSWAYWSTRDVTRNDFGATIQVGIGAGISNTYKFDYFQGTNSGSGAGNTAALTWPNPTLSASASGASVGSGVLTMPKSMLNGSCSQSGSFADITLVSPMLSAATPANANVNVALPLPVFDTMMTGSNNLTGQAALLPIQAAGTELNGCFMQVALSLRQQGVFNVESATSPHSDIHMTALRCHALTLTGSVATAEAKMPSLQPEGVITISHLITSMLKLPRQSTAGSLATGANCTTQGQCTMLQLCSALATGNTSSCNISVPNPGSMSASFTNPIAEGAPATPCFVTEAVGCRDFYR